MKEVHVRRHAPKIAEGHLTENGKEKARILRERLGTFELIISSDKPRAVQTAELLTGLQPTIDKRAGTPSFTLEQEKELHNLGEKHPYGIAGVIFDTPKYREMIRQQGEKLAELIEELLVELSDDRRALVISHDGVMVAAEKILKGLPFDTAGKTIDPLEGYKVDELLNIQDLE
jgi:broad specificity phosphatase PhoE